jgi:uncharacterized protein involved in outer membrane biogenesis
LTRRHADLPAPAGQGVPAFAPGRKNNSCTGAAVQTTLLGIAFAIILALLAALLAPFFVDWTQFRPVFEAEASRVVGLPVRVTGAIDARILPSPSLTLHGLESGAP